MERLYNNILIAILPIYEENIGDCTEIIVQEGSSFILNYKLSTIIKALEKYYMINLKETNRIYSKFINSKNLIPIPFDANNIFIPIKTRVPIFKNDRAFGYINLKSIKGIIQREDFTEINFKNGESIKCFAKKSTVQKHINNGNIVRTCFVKRTMQVYREKNEYNSLIPATKQDIEKLMSMICEFQKIYS